MRIRVAVIERLRICANRPKGQTPLKKKLRGPTTDLGALTAVFVSAEEGMGMGIEMTSIGVPEQ